MIMILAGDAIDKSIGVTLGISTLAAAGFGNLLSDVVGIGAGDVIDRYSEKIIGKPKTKALSLEQLALRSCRIVKTWATIIGITVGCLLGMAPLLFLGEKKELYFTKEEMALYESALRPYGVSPDNFFAMICVDSSALQFGVSRGRSEVFLSILGRVYHSEIVSEFELKTWPRCRDNLTHWLIPHRSTTACSGAIMIGRLLMMRTSTRSCCRPWSWMNCERRGSGPERPRISD